MTIPTSSAALRRPVPTSYIVSPSSSSSPSLSNDMLTPPRKRKPTKNKSGLRLSMVVVALVCFPGMASLLLKVVVGILQLLRSHHGSKVGIWYWFHPPNYSAVEKAKFLGLPQRAMNSGHGENPSFWNQLSNATCDGQGAPAMLNLDEIQRVQLPQAILIGVQKGGTTALYQYLDQHPNVERTKKELYFLDEDMDKLVVRVGKIPRRIARNLYHQKMRDGIVEAQASEKQKNQHKQRLKQKLLQHVQLTDNNGEQKLLRRGLSETDAIAKRLGESQNEKLDDDGFSGSHHGRQPSYDQESIPNGSVHPNNNHNKKYIMDLTPNYMFHSDRVPDRIRCLVPWVRLFVLLRHPVARARSQYRMKLEMVLPKQFNSYGNPIPTLDEYIENDLNALFEVGVLQDWTKVDFESFWNSEECWNAWRNYVHQGLNAPVGMGLYALQLKPFLDTLLVIHSYSISREEILEKHFLALDSDDLQLETDKTYQRVLKFLGLPAYSLLEYPKVNMAKSKPWHGFNQATTDKKDDSQRYHLSPAVQKRMEVAIAPYNDKLGDLLGEAWSNKWPQQEELS